MLDIYWQGPFDVLWFSYVNNSCNNDRNNNFINFQNPIENIRQKKLPQGVTPLSFWTSVRIQIKLVVIYGNIDCRNLKHHFNLSQGGS